MINNYEAELIKKDLQHVWHPCTQMKDLERYPPLIVYSAQGSFIHTNKGPLIDGISSWWCKPLGHCHPAIGAALQQQLQSFEHVIAANTTHPLLVAFAEKLSSVSQKQHIFFASDGSSAIEIALKLCLHAKQICGENQRTQFIHLENAYHGETLGALSVSDLALYKNPYAGYGFRSFKLEAIPYINGMTDSRWIDASKDWDRIVFQLEAQADQTCAIIFEPLLQGAGGMRCYSADFLNRLGQWAKSRGIYLIADEIMTGCGRTGEWFAFHHCNFIPDLICVSKGLSGGALPLSCVLLDAEIYNLFYGDSQGQASFLHSHTHSANALAISTALATLQVMETEKVIEQGKQLGLYMAERFKEVADLTQKITHLRSLGCVVAGELQDFKQRQLSLSFYQAALEAGALLRPIGHTLYWLPPLNTTRETIDNLAEATLAAIRKLQ